MAIETSASAAHHVGLTVTVSGGADVAPGGRLLLSCRVQNDGPGTLADASLRFVLPPEVAVGANDPAAHVVDALASGDGLTIACEIVLHGALADDAMLPFQAVLSGPQALLSRSKLVVLRVRSRPDLTGPRSFVRLVPTNIRAEIMVEVHLHNSGTAPAHAITIDLPRPVGTLMCEPGARTSCTWESLAPGEARTFAYRVRIVAPRLRRVRATAARVCDRDGNHIALEPSGELTLNAEFDAPSITLRRTGRRMHVTVYGTNCGAGPAYDIEMGLQWPGGFSCAASSLAFDGLRVAAFDRLSAFARARVRADGADILIARIDAGAAYELTFELDATAQAQAGTFGVEMRCDRAVVSAQAELAWSPRADLQLHLVHAPDEFVDIGNATVAVAELINAGDNDTHVTLDIDSSSARLSIGGVTVERGERVALGAGDSAPITIELPLETGRHEGESLPLILTVRGSETAHERADLAFAVRTRFGAPASLPAIPEPPRPELPPQLSPAITLSFTLDCVRIDACIRELRGAASRGHHAAIGRLGVFLPNVVGAGDAAIVAAWYDAREALGIFLDGLALNVRLPSFVPGPDDFVSPHAGAALRAFLDIAAAYDAPEDAGPGADREPTIRLERPWLAQQAARLGQGRANPYALIECVLDLVPVAPSRFGALGPALRSYVAVLRAGLGGGVAERDIDAARRQLVDAFDAAGTMVPDLAGMSAR